MDELKLNNEYSIITQHHRSWNDKNIYKEKLKQGSKAYATID